MRVSMGFVALAALAAPLAAASQAAPQAAAQQSPFSYEEVMVPMRDGVRLCVDVHRPEAQEPLPAPPEVEPT